MDRRKVKYDVLKEVAEVVRAAERTIRSPRDVLKHQRCDLADLREQFRILLLSTKNVIIEDRLISLGSLSASIVHPREIFKPAILASAASIIMYHNHPSGNATPSREDVEFSRRMKKCGELIGIELLDHVIIAGETYHSLQESGAI